MLHRTILFCMVYLLVQAVGQVAPRCQEQQDIAFLVDTTQTMIEQGIIMGQSLAMEILKDFTITEDMTRVAFLAFSDTAKIKFNFRTFFTREEMNLMISNDDSANDTSSLNETLAVMKLLFSEDFGSRDNVSRILIFITNGQFDDTISAVIAKKFLDESHIKLIVAGVGKDINMLKLENLVDDKIRDIFVNEEYNASEMIPRIKELTNQFCEDLMRPPNVTSSASVTTPL